MPTSVLVAGARTPIGKFSGGLSTVPAVQLGGIAIRSALEKSQVSPDQVDYVIMGQVLEAGCGQIPARQAAVHGGIPMDIPATTINKVCLSGLDAIVLADQLIRAGEYTTVVAGGMESMTLAPHLLPGSRSGFKYGNVTLVDHMANDGLTDVFTDVSMGVLTDDVNTELPQPVSRADQDAYAVRSHRLAAAAQAAGLFDDEIVPVTVKSRRGETVVTADEGVRADTTLESLAKLRPSFRPDGTITAGTASPISDGAAAVVVMDKAVAEANGIEWLAEIGPSATVAGPDSTLQMQPVNAIRAVCKKAGIEPTALDLVEINEAFAAVALTTIRELDLDPEVVNVDGGAIACGHPIGASGARLALHMALMLGRRGGGTGVVTLCGGGGQGEALLLTVPARG
jgi:acetyl-CoA C-acetyltransferase